MKRAAGFSLIEVLVALALAGAILLVASGFYWLQVRIAERLDAARRADGALENAYEELRASGFEPSGGPLGTTADGVTLEALVEPTESERLIELTLVASYEVRGEPKRRELVARIFTP